jgi:two-component system, NtrC family, nitrogen regulation sensor histidine kinase GlnL
MKEATALSAVAALDILNALPHPLLCLDAQDSICWANVAAQSFLNLPLSALTRRAFASLLPAHSPLLALVQEARLAQSSFAEYGVEFALSSGPRVVGDIILTPLHEPENWFLLTLQSRSVALMINRHLNHQGAARSVVGVAAMLAHEIKNPLSGIRGAAQLLEEGADEGGRELTQLICAEVDRVRALVDRMETFSDTRPMELREENIHAILGHVYKVAHSGFARDIHIKERYDPSLPPILANRDKLVQVFLNLVKNAVEASERKKEITITTAYRHGLRVSFKGASRRISLPLEVCIIDQGPGVPEELIDHIFEPFVTSKPSGSGLGLALVAKVIGDHGGIVEYDRLKDPERTVFRVLLPVYRGQE